MRLLATSSVAILGLALSLAVGCGDDTDVTNTTGDVGGMASTGGAGGSGGGGVGGQGGGPNTFGGDRPVELQVPESYDPNTPAPLVILLHGYTASGGVQNAYFGMSAVAEERGVLLAYPDGTIDAMDNGFWNATDACCNFFGSPVDDSAYLRQLVDDIRAEFNVDPKQIHFVGHSNGGFMSYRMACDHADIVASVASLAGAAWLDADDCGASEPVHVLQIHGTMDETVLFEGGTFGADYPSAQATVDQWANTAGCDTTADETAAPLDLDASIAGDESTVAKYEAGCMAGGSAELWTIPDGGHIPTLSDTFTASVIDWLLAHPKP